MSAVLNANRKGRQQMSMKTNWQAVNAVRACALSGKTADIGLSQIMLVCHLAESWLRSQGPSASYSGPGDVAPASHDLRFASHCPNGQPCGSPTTGCRSGSCQLMRTGEWASPAIGGVALANKVIEALEESGFLSKKQASATTGEIDEAINGLCQIATDYHQAGRQYQMLSRAIQLLGDFRDSLNPKPVERDPATTSLASDGSALHAGERPATTKDDVRRCRHGHPKPWLCDYCEMASE